MVIQKGQILNPKGRAKGPIARTQKFMDVYKRAAGDADRVYDELREHMKAGDMAAYKLYQMYYISPRAKEERKKLAIVSIEDKPTIDTYMRAVTDLLMQFEDCTRQEALETLKAISSVKLNEELADSNKRYSPEELDERIKQLTNIIDHAEDK